MIQICEMYKTYRINQIEIQALKNINLNIKQNEFAAIVGPSGSGKSTLMNMMGCLDVSTSGSYILDDEEVSSLSDDELALIYHGLGSKERLRKAKSALENVGLGDRLDHRPNELSGGQQQRVAVARALVNNPPIIFADEPTGNLDTKSGIEIMNILKELHKKGNTIILITHDNDIALQADRIIRINDGEIVEDRQVI